MSELFDIVLDPPTGELEENIAVIVAEGTFHGSGKWSLNRDGLLEIEIEGGLHAFYPDDVPWDKHRSDISKVHLGEGITSIGAYAFSHCCQLKLVKIPGTVEYIGKYAFSWCNSLTEIVISNGVDTIGNHAFSYCENLTQLYIPSCVTHIHEDAFTGCNKLKKVTMPSRFNRLFFEKHYGISKRIVTFY